MIELRRGPRSGDPEMKWLSSSKALLPPTPGGTVVGHCFTATSAMADILS